MSATPIKIIDTVLLDSLSDQARESERLRKNFNLHDDYAEPCQRLLNALEPGTYIRPHRHTEPPKPECFLALRGAMALVIFEDDGTLRQVIRFGAEGPVHGADVPPGVWHTVVALEPESIFFETKPGPYVPLSDKDFASWAPKDDEPNVAGYLAALMAEIDQR